MHNEEYADILEQRKQEQLPVVLTPVEAMDILGVGKNTMYRLLSSGQLQGVRVGRSWRIKLESLSNFLGNTK